MSERVVILLATFNGAAHLPEQLASYRAQSHKNWEVIASDDGSTDGTLAMLDDFARETGRVAQLAGPRQGLQRNFFSLLRAVAGEPEFAALSDQDDVWHPEKLARAVARLRGEPRAALYVARATVTDATLRPTGETVIRPTPGFGRALAQCASSGNTMVLNRAAIDLVQAALTRVSDAAMHDWWLCQMITGAGGVIVPDEVPVLLYRQHRGNAIGANRGLGAALGRVWFILRGRLRGWNALNIAALRAAPELLTADAQATLDAFSQAREAGAMRRLRALRRSGVTRTTAAGTLALYLAALFRRL